MSIDSRIVADEDYNNNDKAITTYHRRDMNIGSSAYYTSPITVNFRELQNDLQIQHQHEKSALTELNRRFQLFVDRVQVLQSQNAKYLAAIADFRGQSSSISNFDVEWDERYLLVKSNLSTLYNTRIDYEWDFEVFQLQIAIYQQLIAIEEQWKNNRLLVLQDELKQSSSVLIAQRTSYAELQREVENFYLKGEDLFKQYLSLTYNWCSAKKKRSKWSLSIETLKSYIVFYKNLRPYWVHGSISGSFQSEDMTQYWRLELDKVVKRIRQDFEAFYAAIYQEMVAYYEAQMQETEISIKKASQNQTFEVKEVSMTYQAYQVEYEKVQQSLSYEKEVLIKLEATYSQLEAKYNSVHLQYEERLGAHLTKLHSAQENIMAMAYDVEEIKRIKVSLEAEIIIYRLLLESIGIERQTPIITYAEPIGSEMMGKIIVKSHKKRSIGIKECAPNGAYISLVNHSTNKDIDISKWILVRDIDSMTKHRYIIPDGVRLERRNELRIYANSGTATAETSSHQKLVNHDIVSWGMGNLVQTRLFNKNGDEEASHTQTIAF